MHPPGNRPGPSWLGRVLIPHETFQSPPVGTRFHKGGASVAPIATLARDAKSVRIYSGGNPGEPLPRIRTCGR